MSGRARRAAAAAALDAPSAPMAEVRTRKWTRQLKTVGHLSLWKWVPDQELPTPALQKGVFKKVKGRKRPPVEVGRMTRSVRQHLDAPLELLNEYPVLRPHSSKHSSTASSPAPPTTQAAPAQPPTATSQVPAATKPPLAPSTSVEPAAVPTQVGDAIHAPPVAADVHAIPLMADGHQMLPGLVASDEQLELALDDLPMLDTDEDLPLDAFLGPSLAVPSTEPPHQGVSQPTSRSVSEPSSKTSSAVEDTNEDENTADESAASVTEEDDGSVNSASASPLPSPSPATSPLMPSRSPSP